MKLRQKFSLAVIASVLLVLILTALTLYGSRRMLNYKNYQHMQLETKSNLSDLIDYLEQLDNWGFKTSTAYREWEEIVKSLDGNFDYLKNAPVTKDFSDDFKELLLQTGNLWELLKNRFNPVENDLKEIQEKKLPIGVKTHVETNGVRYAVERLPDDETLLEILELVEKIHDQINGIRRCYKSLNQVAIKTSYLMEDVIAVQQKIVTITSISLALLVCILLACLITLMTSKVTKRIIKVRNLSEVLSEKNFTESLKPEGSDEMRSLMTNMNNMVLQVNEFFQMVKNSANKAIASGTLIGESAETIANATNEINSNIENIDAKFSEISNAIERSVNYIAEMDVQVDVLVENNQKQTAAISDSNNSVNEVVTALEKINKMAVERTGNAQEMHNLIEDGDKKISAVCDELRSVTAKLDEVKGVIEIINNVAKKTNLLSMNAAIESAHAGEAGKGFAVVAGEIRGLSDTTAANAEKIENVIKSIVDSVSEANRSSLDASSAYEKVSVHADNVVNSLTEITKGVGLIDEQMHQIKSNTEETAEVAGQITVYCSDIAKKQANISDEVETVNLQFRETMEAISHIKNETGSIVQKMVEVTEISETNNENMADLKNVLAEFKTSSAETKPAVTPKTTSAVHEPPVTPKTTSADTKPPVTPKTTSADTKPPVTPKTTGAVHEPPVTPKTTGVAHDLAVAPKISGVDIKPAVAPKTASADVKPAVTPKTTGADVKPAVTPKTTGADVKPPVTPKITSAVHEPPVAPKTTVADTKPAVKPKTLPKNDVMVEISLDEFL